MSALMAHGMAARAAPRDWPPLTVVELAPVFGMYPDLGAPRAVTWHSPRPFAASGTIATSRGEVFVKRHHRAVRTAADLAEEHAFIYHLRQAGAPVPDIFSRPDGVTAPEHGDCTYELHALSPGLDLYRDDVSWTPIGGVHHAAAAGCALRVLHEAAAGFEAPTRRTNILVADMRLLTAPDLVAAIAVRAASSPLLAAALMGRPWFADVERFLSPWHARLLPHVAALAPLWTHNDFHASNLLWRRDGGVATILDFGLANRTCALFDLATAIERNAIAWLRLADGVIDIGRPDLARALIQGYGLTEGQMPALLNLLPLVHVEFALSELAYFHGVTRSAANAELAYSGFLLGHANWFATSAGRDFVDAVQ
jgi:Ser/Thr protein kinase RdoA (MazF antagonist)